MRVLETILFKNDESKCLILISLWIRYTQWNGNNLGNISCPLISVKYYHLHREKWLLFSQIVLLQYSHTENYYSYNSKYISIWMIHRELSYKKINQKLLHEKAVQNDSALAGWGFISHRLHHSRKGTPYEDICLRWVTIVISRYGLLVREGLRNRV